LYFSKKKYSPLDSLQLVNTLYCLEKRRGKKRVFTPQGITSFFKLPPYSISRPIAPISSVAGGDATIRPRSQGNPRG
jgi:hypothetical protein